MVNGSHAIASVIASTPAFPPSFDNDPWLFGWALFSRMVIFMLSSATIVRLISRNRVEQIDASHPVFYHRMVVLCFCTAGWLASGGDTLTFLLWGETTTNAMALVLTVSKIADGLTFIPFTMALFVPFWMTWLRWRGIVKTQQGLQLRGSIVDLKVTWTNGVVPFRLVILCAVASALTAAFKYAAWAAHVTH